MIKKVVVLNNRESYSIYGAVDYFSTVRISDFRANIQEGTLSYNVAENVKVKASYLGKKKVGFWIDEIVVDGSYDDKETLGYIRFKKLLKGVFHYYKSSDSLRIKIENDRGLPKYFVRKENGVFSEYEPSKKKVKKPLVNDFSTKFEGLPPTSKRVILNLVLIEYATLQRSAVNDSPNVGGRVLSKEGYLIRCEKCVKKGFLIHEIKYSGRHKRLTYYRLSPLAFEGFVLAKPTSKKDNASFIAYLTRLIESKELKKIDLLPIRTLLNRLNHE